MSAKSLRRQVEALKGRLLPAEGAVDWDALADGDLDAFLQTLPPTTEPDLDAWKRTPAGAIVLRERARLGLPPDPRPDDLIKEAMRLLLTPNSEEEDRCTSSSSPDRHR